MSARPTCALSLLCLVQASERFAFFAILPFFVLYLEHHHGVSEHGAVLLLGVFLAWSYLACLLGGALADRGIGRFGSMLFGAILLACGYAALALDYPLLLGPALILQIAGHGLFKPGISVSMGALYRAEDSRRERGFLVQHMAVNLGAIAGPLFGEWSRTRGWSEVFAWATTSMLVAVVILLLGRHRLLAESVSPQPTSLDLADDVSSQARVQTIRLLCAIGVIFWLTAQQAGTSLALFAEFHTHRSWRLFRRVVTFGPGHFASLHGLLVLALLPLLLSVFSFLRRRGCEPSTFSKMIWGYLATAAAFAIMGLASLRGGDGGRVDAIWLSSCYALLSLAELLLAPMSLSLVTQLAPPRQTSRMVGLWFATTAVGNVLAGAAGLLWGRWTNHAYFATLALSALGAAAMLLTRYRRLNQVLRLGRRPT